MGRARSLAVLLGVALIVLAAAPAPSLAGTYTWNLTSDFTSVSPGANPDKDSYGLHPWSYEEGRGTLLPKPFDPNIDGGLAGWKDPAGAPFVAINRTGSDIVTGSTTYPAGQVAMQPSSQPAQVTWTSPVSGTVTVSGTTNADMAGTVTCPNADWALLKNGSSTGTAGVAGSAPFSPSITVAPGDRISLRVSSPLVSVGTCTATSVTLSITQSVTAPAVSLSSPAGGAVISGAQPTFSGAASSRFGDSSTITVRVYSGSSATGTPVQTITTSRSGSGFSAGPNSALTDGAYTATAEQTDLAGDTGVSRPLTFRIKMHPPALTITQPVGGANTFDTAPVLSGAGGTALGDASHVAVTLFSGSTPRGGGLGTVQAPITGGVWTVHWPHSVKLGLYTVQAAQTDDAGHTTVINRTFRIVPAPPVIGAQVTISRSGSASVPVSCIAPSGHVCTGDVLVVSVKKYRTVTGGPSGRIRVLFAYVSIPGGRTQLVKRAVQADALRALRRLHGIHVVAIATLNDSGAPAKTFSATRVIRVAGR